MPKLINVDTKLAEHLPPDVAAASFLKGSHNLPGTGRVALNDPTGAPVNIDPSEVYAAITKGGYTFPSDEQVKEAELQEKYGEGVGNAATAFGESALSAGTFGASDVVGTATGLMDPEGRKERAKRNPISSGAGTATGVVGSLFIPGSPVARVAKLGQAVEKGVGSAIASEGAKSLARKVIEQAGTRAAGSAVEGLAYGAGQVVTDAALGDPDLTAEKVATTIGLSGLLGGALGGVVGTGEVLAPEILATAKTALAKTSNLLNPGEAVGSAYAKASSFVSGKPVDAIENALKNRHSIPTPEQAAGTADDFAKSLQEQHSAVEKALKTATKDIRPEETAKLITAAPEVAHGEIQKVYAEMNYLAKTMREQRDLYPQKYARDLDLTLEGLRRDITPQSSAPEVYAKIGELRKKMDEWIPSGKEIAPSDAQAVSALEQLRGGLKSSLESEQVWGPAAARTAAFSEAQAEYQAALKEFQKNFTYKTQTRGGKLAYEVDPSKVRAFFKQSSDPRGDLKNEVLQRYHEASKKLVDQMDESYKSLPDRAFPKDDVGSVLAKHADNEAKALEQANAQNAFDQLGTGGEEGSLTAGAVALSLAHNMGIPKGPVTAGIALYDVLKNPGLTIQRLAKLERLANKTLSAIERGTKAALSVGDEGFKYLRGPISARVSRETTRSDEDTAEEAEATYRGHVGRIAKLSESPEGALDAMEKATEKIYPHAPNVTASLHNTMTTAVGFLASKIPQPPAPPKPLSPEWVPPRSAIAKFERYHAVVENPLVVLDQIKTGELSIESLEALTTVYPKVYDLMKSEFLDRITESKKPMPYQRRLMLSMFLGQDLDESTSAESIQANQVAINGPSQSNEAQPSPAKATPARADSLNVAGMSLTPQQAAAGRGAKS